MTCIKFFKYVPFALALMIVLLERGQVYAQKNTSSSDNSVISFFEREGETLVKEDKKLSDEDDTLFGEPMPLTYRPNVNDAEDGMV